MAQGPRARATNLSLYFQNIKLRAFNRQNFRKYFWREMSNLPQKSPAKGLDKFFGAETLPRQQRHPGRYQHRRNPAPLIDSLVQKDLRRKGIPDE